MPVAIGPNDQAVIVEVDSPNVTVWPDVAWSFESNATLYTDGSYWLTRVHDARVEFKFTGSEVWLYSDMNSDHGTYTVQIDDGPAQMQSSYSPDHVPQTVLYTTKVTPGPHTLVVINKSSRYFGVDYFAYMPLKLESASATTPANTILPSSAPGVSVTPTATHRGHKPQAVLIYCTVAAALCVVLVLFICFLRRRRRKAARDQEQQQRVMANASSCASSLANSSLTMPAPPPLTASTHTPFSMLSSRASSSSSSSMAELGPFADHYAIQAGPVYSGRRSLKSSDFSSLSETTGTRTSIFSV